MTPWQNRVTDLKRNIADDMKLRIGRDQTTRIVPMAPRLLTQLREYWKARRPSLYPFAEKVLDVPLSPTTIQKMFKASRSRLSPYTGTQRVSFVPSGTSGNSPPLKQWAIINRPWRDESTLRRTVGDFPLYLTFSRIFDRRIVSHENGFILLTVDFLLWREDSEPGPNS